MGEIDTESAARQARQQAIDQAKQQEGKKQAARDKTEARSDQRREGGESSRGTTREAAQFKAAQVAIDRQAQRAGNGASDKTLDAGQSKKGQPAAKDVAAEPRSDARGNSRSTNPETVKFEAAKAAKERQVQRESPRTSPDQDPAQASKGQENREQSASLRKLPTTHEPVTESDSKVMQMTDSQLHRFLKGLSPVDRAKFVDSTTGAFSEKTSKMLHKYKMETVHELKEVTIVGERDRRTESQQDQPKAVAREQSVGNKGMDERSRPESGKDADSFFRVDDRKTDSDRALDVAGLIAPQIVALRGLKALLEGQVSTDYLVPGIGQLAVIVDETPRLGFTAAKTVDMLGKHEWKEAFRAAIDTAVHAQNVALAVAPFLEFKRSPAPNTSEPTTRLETKTPETETRPREAKLEGTESNTQPKVEQKVPETTTSKEAKGAQPAADEFKKPGAQEAEKVAAKPDRPTLVGRNESTFRRDAQRLIRNEPNHPLKFLLDDEGKFKRTKGLKHSELSDASDLVQMGHIESKKAGGERIVLQGAWENQFNNVTVEHPGNKGVRKLVYIENVAIDIGGIGVELETAKVWEREGRIPPGTVVNSRRIP
jgi:hypothetical protein